MTSWSNPCNSDIKSGARIIAEYGLRVGNGLICLFVIRLVMEA